MDDFADDAAALEAARARLFEREAVVVPFELELDRLTLHGVPADDAAADELAVLRAEVERARAELDADWGDWQAAQHAHDVARRGEQEPQPTGAPAERFVEADPRLAVLVANCDQLLAANGDDPEWRRARTAAQDRA